MSHDVSAPTGDRRALALLVSKRPRNVGWRQAAGLLFGDWGTSRLYVLGLAFFFAPQSSLWLMAAMSLLLVGVGWAYTQICRVYPDGGGVYSAAKKVSRTLAVIGALLLFADYVVTASLSSLDAFHYFGLHSTESLFAWGSPGLWAMVAIVAIGILNLLGPRHTGGFAVAAALGMVVATFIITCFALPKVDWHALPGRIMHLDAGTSPRTLWVSFVGIVLALSGVEAIGNLTGVMKKPVAKTARKAIWVVCIEVALFNLLLAIAMVAILPNSANEAHKEDMMAFLASAYVGPWMELTVRILGGVLLLSAVNTVITDMISVQYLLSRDGEIPRFFQGLNQFGVPWIGAIIATVVPCVVLIISHDLENLAALYAIGVVGAVAINIVLVSRHPRLHGWTRRIAAASIGLFLLAIWITLALSKHEALIFVAIVLTVGLTARYLTKLFAGKQSPTKLLREAVGEQMSAETFGMTKVMLATAGSARMAQAALEYARQRNAALVVAFVREISLSDKGPGLDPMGLDTDLAAQAMFAEFLHAGHNVGVPVIPFYDAGPEAVELLAEAAAVNAVEEILIGSSRRGKLHQLIKGSFQRKLEGMLPPEIRVTVLEQAEQTPSPVPHAQPATA